MNIHELAQKANVSVATVSRVLNGSDRVKPETRKRVEQVMAEQHYHRFNAHARRRHMKNISIIMASNDEWSADFLKLLMEQLQQNGYRSMLSFCQMDLSDLHAVIDGVTPYVDAYIIFADRFVKWPQNERLFLINLSRNLPVFLMNYRVDSPEIYNFVIDNAQSMYAHIDEQIKKDHQKVLFLFSNMSNGNLAMLEQYKAAFEANHLEVSSRLLHMCSDDKSLMTYVRNLLEEGEAIDEILISGPMNYMQAGKVLHEFDEYKNIPIARIELMPLEYVNLVADIVNQRLVNGHAAEMTVVVPNEKDWFVNMNFEKNT